MKQFGIVLFCFIIAVHIMPISVSAQETEKLERETTETEEKSYRERYREYYLDKYKNYHENYRDRFEKEVIVKERQTIYKLNAESAQPYNKYIENFNQWNKRFTNLIREGQIPRAIPTLSTDWRAYRTSPAKRTREKQERDNSKEINRRRDNDETYAPRTHKVIRNRPHYWRKMGAQPNFLSEPMMPPPLLPARPEPIKPDPAPRRDLDKPNPEAPQKLDDPNPRSFEPMNSKVSQQTVKMRVPQPDKILLNEPNPAPSYGTYDPPVKGLQRKKPKWPVPGWRDAQLPSNERIFNDRFQNNRYLPPPSNQRYEDEQNDMQDFNQQEEYEPKYFQQPMTNPFSQYTTHPPRTEQPSPPQPEAEEPLPQEKALEPNRNRPIYFDDSPSTENEVSPNSIPNASTPLTNRSNPSVPSYPQSPPPVKPNLDYHYRRGMIALQNQHYGESHTIFKTLISHYPRSEPVRQAYELSLFTAGKYDETSKMIQQAVSQPSNNIPRLWFNFLRSDTSRAHIERLVHHIERHPNDQNALYLYHFLTNLHSFMMR